MGFRDKIKSMKQDLVKTTQERIERGDDTPEYGSYFIKEKIPEGVGFWKPGVGEHLIDVIPWQSAGIDPKYRKDQWVDIVDVWVHMNVGSLFEQFVCQVRAWKEIDPMCEYLRAKRLPTEEWKQIAPKRRCAFLVWVHDTPEEEEKGIQIWEVSHYFSYRNIDKIAKNPRGGAPVPYSHVIDGKSIAFEIQKSGSFTDSQGKEHDSLDFVGYRFVDRETEIPDEFGDKIFPLDACVRYKPTWEEQEKAFPLSKEILLAPATKEPTEEKQTDDDMEEEEEKKLVVGYQCEHCQADVYDTPSGRVCAEGHGGIDGEEIPKPIHQKKEEPEVEEGECPGGGTIGVDMEKLPECAKCEIWDDCADAADKLKAKQSKPKQQPKEEPAPKKKIMRRRRRA